MTYPTYGSPDNYGGYQAKPPTQGLPAPGYHPSGPFPSQQPYGSGPLPQPPRPKRNNTMVALTIALVLFVGLSATFTALWLIESGHHHQTSASLDSKEKELSDARRISQDTDHKLKDAEKARDDAQGQVTELTKCRDAARALMDAVDKKKEDIAPEVDAMYRQCGR
jgi:hypothetical protein